ncbi:lantibiotic protection ABC transporter ATP-binding protein [Arabiibacter massiliensis]|uniref:lantibiotic protection ABC transporter ATP-binding protein n=1 Tax=Arabiibacter massiliensis TaxID=1870985 RepID=UPI0009BBB947|nr:lantibiotic protection ABC transporter ATP-binding protein [Arabiibacter massiliensis]
MAYVLETDALTKRFKGQTAVDGCSLHVPEGAVYGLLGPNGAGKSTLLKMVCGMLRPTSGGISFAGRPWTRDDLNDIGALIETPPLYDNLTARENLRVRTTLLGVPEERIDEALSIVDLAGTGSKRAGRFSLGMKQRLGIALALVGHPRLLILDEPTNGLDPVGIQELRALIRSFPARGITVVLSSHILGEVEHVADLVGIIVEGRLAYEAPIERGADLERLFMDVCLGKAVA